MRVIQILRQIESSNFNENKSRNAIVPLGFRMTALSAFVMNMNDF